MLCRYDRETSTTGGGRGIAGTQQLKKLLEFLETAVKKEKRKATKNLHIQISRVSEAQI